MNKKILFAAMMAFVSLRLYSHNYEQYNVYKNYKEQPNGL